MKIKWFLIAGGVFALAGCGGGGNDEGFDFTRAPAMTLTSDGADLATAVVLDGMAVATDAGDGALDFSGGAIGVKIETDSHTDPSETAVELAIKASGYLTSTFDGGPVAAVIEQTEPCTVSGSVTVSIDTGSMSQEEFTLALQEGGIPPGTAVGMRFQQCVELDGEQIDGGFTVTFVTFPLIGLVGFDDLVIEIRADFDNLQADGQVIHGDLTVMLTSSITGAIDIQSSGSLLQLTVDGNTTTLIDYLLSLSDDGVEFVETSIDFIINDTRLAGELIVTTLTPFITNKLDDRPLSGSLQIAGAGGTTVTVIVLDSVTVQIDVDVDGDGTADVTTFSTWDELDALSLPAA